MLEILNTTVANIPVAVVVAVMAAILRSVAGYLENIYKDGKDQGYEVTKLIGTVVQYFGYIMLLMLGMPTEQAIAGAFVLDAVKSSLVKMK